jgi:hypothetical protein
MSTTLRAPRRALLSVGSALAIGAGLLVACGPSQKPSTTPQPATSGSASGSASASTSIAAAPPKPKPLAANAVGSFGPGTFGPTIAHGANGNRGAIVVAAPSSPTGRRWIAQALDDAGKPRPDAKHELAEAPEDTSVWQVTAVGDGFVLAWTRATDSGAQLLALSLSADGTPQGAPSVVARGGEEIVDVRITTVPGAEGSAALLTFGERSVPKGMASAVGTLYAIPLDAAGRPVAPAAMRLGERLGAWSVAAIGKGQVAAALVQHAPDKQGAAAATGDDAKRNAKLVVLTLGAKGVVAAEPLLLAEGTVLPEIDVVRLPEAGKAVVLFTDRREIDEHIFSVVVDATGPKPRLEGKARRAVPPRGEQSIVALAPTPSGPILLWEDSSPRPTHELRRRFSLARLSTAGETTSRPRAFWFPYDDNLPELAVLVDRDASGVATTPGDDVAVLTYGSACLFDGAPEPAAGKQAACSLQDLRPFVVRFAGPTLAPAQTDMIDVDVAGGTVAHAFDLTCRASGCEVLAEGPTDPAIVALTKLPTRAAPPPGARWVYTEAIDAPTSTPRLESATALGRESQFAGLHTARTQSGGAFVAWVTYAPDDIEEDVVAVKGKGKGGGKVEKGKAAIPAGAARVAARAVDAAGDPLGPVNVVSERALSKGDVAVAASAVEKAGGVVAYVSRGEGDEEVYVAKMDDTGKRVGGNVRITHTPGGASDVALTPLPAPEGGYLLAWVDARKNAPGVYAVRLDKSGNKQGAEVRIGGGAADLADVSLATIGTSAQGPKVALVWSDARDNASTGYADIWMTIVGSRDLKALVPEHALVRTTMHSHSPVIAARGDGGAIVGWLEDDPNATEMIALTGKDDWGAFVARIDGTGNLAQQMTPVALDPALGKGIVSGVAVDCPPLPPQAAMTPVCRVALSFGDKEGVTILTTTLSPTPPAARVLWSYRGAGSQEASPALAGNAIYLCEDGLEVDDGRVRRLAVTF